MTPKDPTIRKAEAAIAEILDALYYDTTSIVHKLVAAHRHGMPPENGHNALTTIAETVEMAQQAYAAAIAQPQNKITARPEVRL